jgi:hypothetical protein
LDYRSSFGLYACSCLYDDFDYFYYRRNDYDYFYDVYYYDFYDCRSASCNYLVFDYDDFYYYDYFYDSRTSSYVRSATSCYRACSATNRT